MSQEGSGASQSSAGSSMGGLRALLKRLRPQASALRVWTSVAAFVISVYTFIDTRQPPSVELIAPRQARVAQAAEVGTYVYLQPALIATGSSQRSEVILDLLLWAEPRSGGDRHQLRWDEVGHWTYDSGSQRLTWQYTGDPGPLLLNPGNAQAPVLLFVSSGDWRFDPGSYRLILEAERAAAQGRLRSTMELTLTAEDLELLEESGGASFLTFELDR